MSAPVTWLIAALAILVAGSSALAQEGVAHLIWKRPVGSHCPSGPALERDVERVLGRRVFGPREDARLIVVGEVEETADGVRARIDVRRPDGTLAGTRELAAPPGRCEALLDEFGLVLALIAERAFGEDPAESGEPGFGAGFVVDTESTPLPRTAVSFGLALALAFDSSWSLSAAAKYWLPVTAGTPRDVGATFEAASVAARACTRAAAQGALGLWLCVGLEAGALVATPRQVDGPTRQVRLLAHGLLELRGRARLSHVAVAELALGPILSLSRPEFSYRQLDGVERPVHRPNLVGGLLSLALIIVTP